MNGIHVDQEPVSPQELSGIDLNLLVAFDALIQEGSVTRAAQRMNITQSAMSHTLRRLRDLFDDPLLVRGHKGMLLTPRAEALAVPVRSGMVMLYRAVNRPPQFDPATTQRSFRMASPDLFDVLMLPPLLERLGREAPGINIDVVEVAGRPLMEGLETGEVDMAILPRMKEPETSGVAEEVKAPGLRRQTLFSDRFVCLLRRNHPAVRSRPKGRGKANPASKSLEDPLSLETFVNLPHAVVSAGGSGLGPVDKALGQMGLSRRIALRLPSFSSSLEIIAKSDLVLTGPTGLLRLISPKSSIVALPHPITLPGHDVDMVWHERFSNDPGHAWLRDLIHEVAKSEFGESWNKGVS